jgi:hypothetical protein
LSIKTLRLSFRFSYRGTWRATALSELAGAPIHRRGWGSLYAALCKGRIDSEESQT